MRRRRRVNNKNDKPVKLDILNEIPPQVNEMPQPFIREIKTVAYDVT